MKNSQCPFGLRVGMAVGLDRTLKPIETIYTACGCPPKYVGVVGCLCSAFVFNMGSSIHFIYINGDASILSFGTISNVSNILVNRFST